MCITLTDGAGMVNNKHMDIEAIYSRMGTKIRKAREHCGWTQHQLAERSGITRSVIANLETGRCRLLVHDLVELARTLRVKPANWLR